MEEQQESNEQLSEGAGLTFDGGKKGRVYVVDYGKHMFNAGQWRFRLALQTVRDQINQQCCTGDANELGSVIFFNTTESKTTRENIDCIYVHRELGTMDADYVKRLDEILSKEDLLAEMQPELGNSGTCEWSDLILLCQDMLQTVKALRKKVINIFTTDVVEFIDSNSLKGAEKRVLEELHPKNVDIKVFLLEEDRDEESEFTQFLEKISPEMSRYTNFDQLRERLHFKNYALRSTTSLPFVLGEGFQFAVGLYFLIKPQGKPPAIYLDSETSEKIERRTHFIPEDAEIENNAAPEEANGDLIPGAVEGEVFEGEVNFRRNVGGVDIVLSREELENLRRFDRPGITVIGFKPMKLLKDSHRMSPAKYIYPLDDVISGSSKLYRALLKRCLERSLFILVRYTQKLNTPPQLCALVPQSANGKEGGNLGPDYIYEGFHLLELPFSEEARNLRDRFRFDTPGDGLNIWPSPNDQQIKAAREFVRKLTKTFEPDQFPNPALQRHYKGVETLALDLGLDSFEKEVSRLDSLQPYFAHQTNVDRVANEIANLKKLCQSKEAEIPKRGRRPKKEEMEIDEEEAEFVGPSNPPKRGRKKAA